MIFMTDWHGSTYYSIIIGGARLMHGPFSKILGGPGPPAPRIDAPASISSRQSVGRGPWPKICLRIDMQYLGNAAWYRVGVNGRPTCRPIWNHPNLFGWRMARSLWHSVSLKGHRSLWPQTVGHLCPLSVLVTVPLHFPSVPCHVGGGLHEKVEGHSKTNFPALRAGDCAPPLSNCFRRHCIEATFSKLYYMVYCTAILCIAVGRA